MKGLQPEEQDVDFALILHPDYWDWGRRIFDRIKAQAFGEMGLESLTILLPLSRKNARLVTRWGFVENGQSVIDGREFIRFRLYNPSQKLSA